MNKHTNKNVTIYIITLVFLIIQVIDLQNIN